MRPWIVLTCLVRGLRGGVEAGTARSLSVASDLESAESESDSDFEFFDSISAVAEGIFLEFFEDVLETP